MKNDIKDRYDRDGRKLYTSMGPYEIYRNLSLLTFYTPYWRKICRMLCQMRRMNHIDFTGVCFARTEKYARAAYKDTKLPQFVKWLLRDCIQAEFKFEVDPRPSLVYIGEYSPSCAEKYGSVIWLDNNGQEVEVTCAFQRGKEGSLWEDKRIVSGNLSRYLRKGQQGTHEPMRVQLEPYMPTKEDYYANQS